MGIKEAAVGEAINLGSGMEHRVIDLANMVNVLAGQTLRKFNHQTFKKGLIQTNAFRKSLIKNSNKKGNWENIEGNAEF